MSYASKNSGGGGRDLTPEPCYNKTPPPPSPKTIKEGAVSTTSGSRSSKNEVGQYKK